MILGLYTARASHIVGGEFELRHTEGYQYQLDLFLYFDQQNGEAGAEDSQALVTIFRKSDDRPVRDVILFNLRERGYSFVEYTNPECVLDSLQTRKIIYRREIELNPEEFSDPEGYYVVYERCCRNYQIQNLSDRTRRFTGQTFYLEFPPVTRNGEPFVNSSPVLLPPLSDFASVNQNFFFDFSGEDLDGDSLVYSLVAPYNSSETFPDADTAIALPDPKPNPREEVVFAEGLSGDNMIPGDPGLRISKGGLITIRPSRVGLFVFGVRVEEFRDGEKIGEVRRDFQMLSVDYDPGSPPEITGQVRGASSAYRPGEVITFTAEDEKCLDLRVTDPDAIAEGREEITIQAFGVNFNQDLQELIPETRGVLDGTTNELSFEFCLPDCPYTEDGSPMIIDLVAYDDACSVPLTDTLRITVEVEGPANQDPFIVDNPGALEVTVNAGDTYELPVLGKDNDLDPLTLTAEGVDFDLAEYGMELREERLVPGEVQKTFVWNTDCARYPYYREDDFEVIIRLTDDYQCPTQNPDELRLRLNVTLPNNNEPVISFEGLADTEVEVSIGETLLFDVIAEEQDRDFMTLTAEGEGFDLEEAQINFPGNSGVERISSPFRWDLSCLSVDLDAQRTFQINFIAQDQNQCNLPSGDTVRVTINVTPPENEAPEVSLRNVASDTIVGTIDQPIVFDVVGIDPDADIVTLYLDQVWLDDNPLNIAEANFSFNAVRGRGTVASRFYWVPDCSLLPEDFTEARFTLAFVAEDDKCYAGEKDTVRAYLHIEAVPLGLEDYEPHNAFTPNQDGWGDFFYLRFCDDPQGGCDLPVGNCANSFERIEIFNRWGTKVYESDQPDFQWYAEGMGSGPYYFLAYYSRETYKGRVYLHRPDFQ